MNIYLKESFKKPVIKRALLFSLFVGIVLNLINQYDALIHLNIHHIHWLQLALTFLVPYLVSTISSVLSKLYFASGEVAATDAHILCNHCRKEETIVHRGDIVPFCNRCTQKTKWSIVKQIDPLKTAATDKKLSLAMFAELNPSPVIRVDKHGIIIDANPIAKLVLGLLQFGVPAKEVLPELDGIDFEKFIHKNDLKTIVCHHGDEFYNLELRGISEYGIVQLYGSNITELKKSQEVIQSLALFSSLNPEPVFRFNNDFILIEANPAAKIAFPGMRERTDIRDIFPGFNACIPSEMMADNKTSVRVEQLGKQFFRLMIKGVSELGFCQVYCTDITKNIEAEKEIREKNENIQSSIRYASLIQNAILPEEERIRKAFTEYFLLYMPKDIVSGDFYWVLNMVDKVVLIVADCTGHGIPGSMMSMLGHAFLNEIINSKPDIPSNEIANRLRILILTTFSKSYRSSTFTDGMDISICIIDSNKKEIDFTGANQSALIIESGKSEVIKGNKMPIGKYQNDNVSFSNEIIKYNPGDILYLFTDGYPTQLGGERGKKFYSKQFYELLSSVYMKPMVDQKIILKTRIDDWMKNEEQTDDITVLGVRLN